MTSDQFEIGTKFRYKNKDLMVLNYWFNCGGHVMIVQAIKYKINECSRLLWVYDVYDHSFDKCELIEEDVIKKSYGSLKGKDLNKSLLEDRAKY